jgi:hypothetical protein
VDINQIVERFLNEAVWQCKNDGGKEDESVIRALNNRNQSAAVRQNEVLKWLRYYGVLQGLSTADRDAVANIIVEFADARGATDNPLS